jgi:hypothetical protein
VLRRRRAAGTTAAGRACVWRASAVATRSGAAGQGRTNRGYEVLLAAISGRVIRVVRKAPDGVDARRMSRGEPLDRRGCESVRTEGPRFRRGVATADAGRTRRCHHDVRHVQDRTLHENEKCLISSNLLDSFQLSVISSLIEG